MYVCVHNNQKERESKMKWIPKLISIAFMQLTSLKIQQQKNGFVLFCIAYHLHHKIPIYTVRIYHR